MVEQNKPNYRLKEVEANIESEAVINDSYSFKKSSGLLDDRRHKALCDGHDDSDCSCDSDRGCRCNWDLLDLKCKCESYSCSCDSESSCGCQKDWD